MTDELRLAVLTNGYAPRLGGIERQLSLLLPRIAAAGVDVAVFTRRDPGTDARSLLDEIPVRRFATFGGKPGAAVSFGVGALAALHRFDPHVVHAHEFFSCATVGVARKRLYGTPLVVTPHGADAGRLDRKRFGVRRWRAMLGATDRFGLISGDHDDELAGRGVPSSQRQRIGAAVDETHFTPPANETVLSRRATLGLPIHAPVAVYTGRVSAEKRIDLLLDAWPIVQRSCPDAQLLIVGDGEERSALLGRRVPGCRFVGRVDDVLPYLQAADVYVHASLFEGFSSSILEAMSVGLPVVATPARGVAEAIGETGAGIVVRDWVPDLLAHAVTTLLHDPVDRAALGERGRRIAADRHGANAIAGAWVALYRELAGATPARARDGDGSPCA